MEFAGRRCKRAAYIARCARRTFADSLPFIMRRSKWSSTMRALSGLTIATRARRSFASGVKMAMSMERRFSSWALQRRWAREAAPTGERRRGKTLQLCKCRDGQKVGVASAPAVELFGARRSAGSLQSLCRCAAAGPTRAVTTGPIRECMRLLHIVALAGGEVLCAPIEGTHSFASASFGSCLPADCDDAKTGMTPEKEKEDNRPSFIRCFRLLDASSQFAERPQKRFG